MKRKNKGFTLVETLLVVGFVALASVGVYVIFNKAQAINVANDEAILLNGFKKDIEESYNGAPTYAGLDNISLNTNRITPLQLRDDTAGNIVNRFGGNVTVSPIAYGGVPNVGFRINYPGVSKSSCPILAMNSLNDFDIIIVNGSTIKGIGVNNISPSALTSACSSGSASASTLEFQTISTAKHSLALASAPPAFNPLPGTEFEDETSQTICDFNDAGYTYGSGTIPYSARNMVLFYYESVDNNIGRCINYSEYGTWINSIQAYKSTYPLMSYQDIVINYVGPNIVNTYSSSPSKATRISQANSACQTAANAQIATGRIATYKQYSRNKCLID